MTPLDYAIRYFIERAGFSRLFHEFSKTIERLGTVGGTAKLKNLTSEEKVVLRNWFQKDYSNKTTATINLKSFEKRFKGTQFDGASLFDVVEGVLGRPLEHKKKVKQAQEEMKVSFYEQLLSTYDSKGTRILTEYINRKHPATIGYSASYNKGERKEIEKVYKALFILPLSTPMRLPLFADKVAGNPHEFDNHTKLITALQMIKERAEGTPIQNQPNAEYVNQLLFEFGIIKDDIANHVTTYGLVGERKGRVLQSWIESFLESSVRNEPLREIAKIDKVYPIKKGNPVFIIENSSVYSSIIDDIHGLPLSVICTHGQFKVAALYLIKLLAEEGCTLYYAGDMDPEGISMAYSLKKKYPNSIRYWKYSVADYVNHLSDVELSESRLSMLTKIEDEELSCVIQEMVNKKVAAYQERHLSSLIEDIKQWSDLSAINV